MNGAGGGRGGGLGGGGGTFRQKSPLINSAGSGKTPFVLLSSSGTMANVLAPGLSRNTCREMELDFAFLLVLTALTSGACESGGGGGTCRP